MRSKMREEMRKEKRKGIRQMRIEKVNEKGIKE